MTARVTRTPRRAPHSGTGGAPSIKHWGRSTTFSTFSLPFRSASTTAAAPAAAARTQGPATTSLTGASICWRFASIEPRSATSAPSDQIEMTPAPWA